jgi:Xaa-Pro aminopeptidase
MQHATHAAISHGASVLSRRLLLILTLATWATTLPAQVPVVEYAQRRQAVAAQMKDGVLLALGAREPEQDYLSFFQSSPFYYLTGLKEPDAALVIAKRGRDVTTMLFVEPREPGREAWTGARLDVDGVRRRLNLPGRSVQDLRPTLDSLLRVTPQLYVVGDFEGSDDVLSADAQFVQSLARSHPRLQIQDMTPVVDQLRSRKSVAELALIRKAAEITALAEREAMHAVAPGVNEFEIQALIEYTFRRNGADRPSFATIVGSGPNSTTLHYSADDRFMNAGEVAVMDIGASYRGYAADVTRTVPVSGKFTAEQRQIYQLVRDAQAAAERQAKLAAPARLMDDSSRAVLAKGLAALGLVESPDAAFDAAPGQCTRPAAGGCAQWSLYYFHALGHGIGLDVHDPNPWIYGTGLIEPGSAFTIEPGVYVRASVLDDLPNTPRNRAMIAKLRPAVEKYRNIGVRIEDDYIATEKGVEWVSRAPRELSEVEAEMQQRLAGPSKRNPEIVNWYKATEGERPK